MCATSINKVKERKKKEKCAGCWRKSNVFHPHVRWHQLPTENRENDVLTQVDARELSSKHDNNNNKFHIYFTGAEGLIDEQQYLYNKIPFDPHGTNNISSKGSY